VPDRCNWLPLWLFALGAAIVAVAAWLPPASRPPDVPAPPTAPTAPAAPDPLRLARQQLLARLDEADHAAREALVAQLDRLAGRFAEQRERLPELADHLLSLSAQWRYLADRLPIGAGDRYAAFLREVLHDTLFDPERLRAAVQEAIGGYRQAERAIEDQLLARTRSDLAELPAELTISLPAGLQGPDEHALTGLGESIVGALQAELGRELVALALGEVLARASLRLAVSSGLVGAGEMSTVSTLGLGPAAGLLADRALRIARGDPRDELILRLGQALGELSRRVLDGDDRSTGLQSRLRREARGRSERRRSILLRAIQPGGSP
jgi:hypothetical protein